MHSLCLFASMLFVTDRSPELHTKIWWRVTTTKWTHWQGTRIKRRSLLWSTCFSLCWMASLEVKSNEWRLSQPRLVWRLWFAQIWVFQISHFGIFLRLQRQQRRGGKKTNAWAKYSFLLFWRVCFYWHSCKLFAHFSPQPDSPLDHRFSTYQVNVMQSCDLCGSYIWGMERAYMCSGECKRE